MPRRQPLVSSEEEEEVCVVWVRLVCCLWGMGKNRSTEPHSTSFCSGPLSLELKLVSFQLVYTSPASPIPRTDASRPFCLLVLCLRA